MVVINNRFTAILATAGALSSSMSMPSLVEAAAIQTRQETGGLASTTSSSDIAAMDQPPSSKGRQQILALPQAVMPHSASVASVASSSTRVKQQDQAKDQKEERRNIGFDSTNPMTRLAMRLLGSRSLRMPGDLISVTMPQLLSLHAKKAIAPASGQTSSPSSLAPSAPPSPSPSPAPSPPAPPAVPSPAPPVGQQSVVAAADSQSPSSPSPPAEHYYDAAHNADVSKQGTDNEVTFERRHDDHHVHYDKIIVKGSNDKVRVHGADAKHTKIIVKGDHDRVHLENRHHHHHDSNKVIVKGDHDSVKIDDDHDDHHHSNNKVVVKGDHDHVKIDKRRSRSRFRPHPRAFVETDLEARSPHHHDHHKHHGKTLVIKGDGKTVDVRRREEMTGAPGHVDITSNNVDAAAGTRVASLCLSDDFVLNACDTNSTTIYLAPAPNSASAAAADTPINQVLLQVPVYEPTEAAVVPFCATFDPNPSAPEPLTAERCFNGTTPIQNHKSQTFEYDDTTGVVRPLWVSDGDQAGTAASAGNSTSVAQTAPEDPPTPAEAGVASVTDISSTIPIVRRQEASSSQNVTLVFMPDAPVAAKAVDGSSSSSTSASTASASTTPTGAPIAPSAEITASASLGAQAQATGGASASSSASASSIPPVPSASGSAAASASLGAQAQASGDATSSSASTPTSTPNNAGALNVEIGPMAAAAAPSTTPMAALAPPSTTPMASSSPSTTPMAEAKDSSGSSIDADAIASKIAADRRAFYESNVVVAAANITSAMLSSTPSPTSIIASAKSTASAVEPDVKPSGNAAAAAVTAAEAPKMTPMSTEPYRWVFQREQ